MAGMLDPDTLSDGVKGLVERLGMGNLWANRGDFSLANPTVSETYAGLLCWHGPELFPIERPVSRSLSQIWDSPVTGAVEPRWDSRHRLIANSDAKKFHRESSRNQFSERGNSRSIDHAGGREMRDPHVC